MKKIFSALLIVAMLLGTLALAACETPPENNPDQPPYTNEVELILLGSQKTAEAFAKKDEFATFLETVKTPKVDLTVGLAELLGVSLDASVLCGDDFVGLLLNELTFPMESDDFEPSGAPSSSTLSNIGAYFTKEEFALSLPMLFGEGYYGVKYDNILTYLESLMGPIPEDQRPQIEESFNKMIAAIKNTETVTSPALPQGFTAFLSNLMKEKLSLTKTESNGNIILSFNLTANGLVDILIPRGGKGLISACVQNATVPCIETGTGICHIYVDEAADLEMAVNIIFNAKTQRIFTKRDGHAGVHSRGRVRCCAAVVPKAIFPNQFSVGGTSEGFCPFIAAATSSACARQKAVYCLRALWNWMTAQIPSRRIR